MRIPTPTLRLAPALTFCLCDSAQALSLPRQRGGRLGTHHTSWTRSPRPNKHNFAVTTGRFTGKIISPSEEGSPAAESSRGTVLAVQRSLAANGYYRGPHDGLTGPLTRRAVARFQGHEDLAVTGEIDGFLINALGLREAELAR